MTRIVVLWLLLVVVIGLDASFRGSELSVPREAVYDETAHIATALIALFCCVSQVGMPMLAGALIGSTAIDLDHLPAMAGSLILTAGTNRPYAHSQITVLIVIFLAFMLPSLPRQFMWGVAVGVMSHLLRDMATGGVPLFWPLALSSVTVPYHVFIAALLAGVSGASVREVVSIGSRLIGPDRVTD